MREVGITVSRLYLGYQSPLLVQNALLECIQVNGDILLHVVQLHIGIGGRREFHRLESLIKQSALLYALNQVFGDDLARLPMDGITAEHLRLGGPVFHNLRRQFHEIVLYGKQSAIGHVAEERMEGMPELVEKGGGFVQIEQGGNRPVRTGEIRHDINHRHHPFTVLVTLVPERTAPRPRPLAAGTRIQVHIQDAEQAAVGIVDFVGHAFVVVDRQHRRLERDAVKPVAQLENTLFDIFQREIGPQRLLVEVIPRLAYLLSIIPPVPRGEIVAAVFLALQLLHLGKFPAGPVERRRPYLVEQPVHVLRSLGHVGVEHILRMRTVTEQIGPTRAQFDYLVYQLLVVELVTVVALLYVSRIKLLTQVAARRIGEERQHAGFPDIEKVSVVAESRLFGGIAGRAAHARRQSLHILLIQHHPETRVLFEQVFPETESQFRKPAVYLLEFGLLFGGQIGSRPDEIFVNLLHQTFLQPVEPRRIAALVHLPDAVEQFLVEHDAVIMLRQHRRDLLLYGLHLRIGVSGRHAPEYLLHARKHLPGVVEGENGVLEIGLLRILRNGLYLFPMELHGLPESRHIVRYLDFIERGNAVRRIPFGEQRIGTGRRLLAAAR